MIDISADMGEGSPGEDRIWLMITSANVACGGHIGDDQSMRRAAASAEAAGVRIGAHPSYPDRQNFGRVSMSMAPEVLQRSLEEQIAALQRIAPIQFVKAHGALYNDAHRDRAIAQVLVEAIANIDPSLSIVCPPTSEMALVAAEHGMHVIREAFADRRYEPDGSLTPRRMARSTLSVPEAAEQAAGLAQNGKVVARDGSSIAIAFDTLCVHADMDQAVERLQAIRTALDKMSS